MALEGGALMQDDFVAFSKEFVLFAHVTSRVATDKHQNLLSEKGGRGFPHIVFMDSEGNVIAKHETARNAKGFGETGKKATAFLKVKAKAEKGDKKAKIEYAIQRLEMGSLAMADAETEIKKLGKLRKADQARFDSARATAGVKEVLAGIRGREDQQRAQETFYAWFKEGRPDPSGGEQLSNYCQMILQEAEKKKDADTFENALKRLKVLFGGNPRAKKFFDAQAERLNALRAGGK